MSIIIWAILPLMVIGLIVLRRSKDISVTTSFLSRDSKFGYFFFVSVAVFPLIVLTSYTTMLVLGKGEMYYLWGVPVVYKNFIFSLGLAAIFGLFVVRWIQKRTDIEPIARVYKLNIGIALALLIATSVWQDWHQQEQDPEQIARNATIEELRKTDLDKEDILISKAEKYAGDKISKRVEEYYQKREVVNEAKAEIPLWFQIWKDKRKAELALAKAEDNLKIAKRKMLSLAFSIIAENEKRPESFSLASATNKIKDAVNTPKNFEARPTSDFKIIKHSRNFWEVRFKEANKFYKIFDVRPGNSRILITYQDDSIEIHWKDGSRDALLPASGVINGLFAQPLYIKYAIKNANDNKKNNGKSGNSSPSSPDGDGKSGNSSPSSPDGEKQIFINFVDV